jgi:hypothetical protein
MDASVNNHADKYMMGEGSSKEVGCCTCSIETKSFSSMAVGPRQHSTCAARVVPCGDSVCLVPVRGERPYRVI